MKMNSIIRALLVGGVCVASIACKSNKSAESTATVEVAKPKVTTQVVKVEAVENQSVFTGTVEGYTINNITPQQPRRISRLLVDVGDRVYAGQKVVELDNAALVQAKAQLDNKSNNNRIFFSYGVTMYSLLVPTPQCRQQKSPALPPGW